MHLLRPRSCQADQELFNELAIPNTVSYESWTSDYGVIFNSSAINVLGMIMKGRER